MISGTVAFLAQRTGDRLCSDTDSHHFQVLLKPPTRLFCHLF